MRDRTGLHPPGFLEIVLDGSSVAVNHHGWTSDGWRVQEYCRLARFFAPSAEPHGLNRCGVSGPAVRSFRLPRIRSSGGRAAGSAARLCCSLPSSRQVKQLLANVAFAANVRPLAVGQAPERPGRFRADPHESRSSGSCGTTSASP